MKLCNECASKIVVAFPGRILIPASEFMAYESCGQCHKKRYCQEYEHAEKNAANKSGEA